MSVNEWREPSTRTRGARGDDLPQLLDRRAAGAAAARGSGGCPPSWSPARAYPTGTVPIAYTGAVCARRGCPRPEWKDGLCGRCWRLGAAVRPRPADVRLRAARRLRRSRATRSRCRGTSSSAGRRRAASRSPTCWPSRPTPTAPVRARPAAYRTGAATSACSLSRRSSVGTPGPRSSIRAIPHSVATSNVIPPLPALCRRDEVARALRVALVVDDPEGEALRDAREVAQRLEVSRVAAGLAVDRHVDEVGRRPDAVGELDAHRQVLAARGSGGACSRRSRGAGRARTPAGRPRAPAGGPRRCTASPRGSRPPGSSPSGRRTRPRRRTGSRDRHGRRCGRCRGPRRRSRRRRRGRSVSCVVTGTQATTVAYGVGIETWNFTSGGSTPSSRSRR